ncbi:MAG: hypothetical protein ACFFCW_42570, partial [Candidatus Hodarchaeota archaeon]
MIAGFQGSRGLAGSKRKQIAVISTVLKMLKIISASGTCQRHQSQQQATYTITSNLENISQQRRILILLCQTPNSRLEIKKSNLEGILYLRDFTRTRIALKIDLLLHGT